jgi:hypothetical protein
VSPARAWNPEFWRSAPSYLVAALVAGLVALAITNGVFVLLQIVASPLYVCYRGHHRRWTEMATAVLNPPRRLRYGSPRNGLPWAGLRAGPRFPRISRTSRRHSPLRAEPSTQDRLMLVAVREPRHRVVVIITAVIRSTDRSIQDRPAAAD